MAKKNAIDFAAQDREIIAGLDIMAEYAAMGVQFASEHPRSSGMIECFARGRDESRPSAAVNCNTGKYIDKGGNNESLSMWDFGAKYGGFPDWKAARRHFAEKAGVKLGRQSKDKTENPAEQIDFLDWTDGYWRIVSRWCQVYKPGVSPEALKIAGARFGRYPCYTDKQTGERRKGEFSVIALPCYGHQLLDADPVAWVQWNATGPFLTINRGRDLPPEEVKMKSIGPTRGAMMNRHALLQLATSPEKVEYIIKTGGPSDMLAILSKLPESLLESHLVTTNASGETGDVLPHQVNLFAGHKTLVVGDADEAGEAGVDKWINALLPVASELRKVALPYAVQKKHGKDARDFLNGLESDLVGAS